MSSSAPPAAAALPSSASSRIIHCKDDDEIVTLNVGGQRFSTRVSTLTRYPSTLLGTMFSPHNRELRSPNLDGEYFFDRNPRLFERVLEWYRTGCLDILDDDNEAGDSGDEALTDREAAAVAAVTEKRALGGRAQSSASGVITGRGAEYFNARASLENRQHVSSASSHGFSGAVSPDSMNHISEHHNGHTTPTTTTSQPRTRRRQRPLSTHLRTELDFFQIPEPLWSPATLLTLHTRAASHISAFVDRLFALCRIHLDHFVDIVVIHFTRGEDHDSAALRNVNKGVESKSRRLLEECGDVGFRLLSDERTCAVVRDLLRRRYMVLRMSVQMVRHELLVLCLGGYLDVEAIRANLGLSTAASGAVGTAPGLSNLAHGVGAVTTTSAGVAATANQTHAQATGVVSSVGIGAVAGVRSLLNRPAASSNASNA